jgi:hypothetical protein
VICICVAEDDPAQATQLLGGPSDRLDHRFGAGVEGAHAASVSEQIDVHPVLHVSSDHPDVIRDLFEHRTPWRLEHDLLSHPVQAYWTAGHRSIPPIGCRSIVGVPTIWILSLGVMIACLIASIVIAIIKL